MERMKKPWQRDRKGRLGGREMEGDCVFDSLVYTEIKLVWIRWTPVKDGHY